MKIFNKFSIIALVILFTLGLSPITALAVVPPDRTFGITDTYSVYGHAGITNANAGTRVWGNVGDNNVGHSGFTAIQVPSGIIDVSTANGTAIEGDASSVYDSLMSATQGTPAGAVASLDLAGTHTIANGNPVVPGVYNVGATTLNGTVELNGAGVYIFRSDSNSTISSGGTMILSNGATPCNVFWAIPGFMTIGTGAHIDGTIIAQTGLISIATGASLVGRAISLVSQVTLDNNQITQPTCVIPTPVNGTCGSADGNNFIVAPTTNLCSTGSATSVAGAGPWTWTCIGYDGGINSSTCTATVTAAPIPATLTLVKTIVGGNRTFVDFPLTATGPVTITGDSASPTVTSATVPAGLYALSEATKYDYTAESWSCLKNADPVAVTGDSIALNPGDSAICTIQNNYIKPLLGSGGGGNIIVPPLIDVVKIPSPLALPAGPGLVTYTYTLRNIGTVPVSNMTMIDDSCTPVKYISGDTNSDSKLDVNEIWKYTCSSMLSTTKTNTVTATGWANFISATDIATATVVVGKSVVPPLIHVVKVPSSLTLPAGGGAVIYTKEVTNPGTVPLNNITLVDDKCGPVKYISGDTNNDSKLDPTEIWIYTCSANLTKTTTNTVVVTGQANGLTARDFAIATVVVATPKLPNTGFPPENKNIKWIIVMIIGILLLTLSTTFLIFKKRTV